MHRDLTASHANEEHGRDGKSAANASLRLVKFVLEEARRLHPKLPEWPANAVRWHKDKSKNRAGKGMQASALPAWWSEVRKLENKVAQERCLFTLLSGLRAETVLDAKRSDIDFDRKMIRIPKPKFHRDDDPRSFWLPMTPEMIACVDRARKAWLSKHEPSAYIFPSAKTRSGRTGDIRAQYTVRNGANIEVVDVPTGHVLRHTLINVARSIRITNDDLAVILNHGAKTITESYGDHGTPERAEAVRESMVKISAAIVGAIEPDPSKRNFL
jgi:integrase